MLGVTTTNLPALPQVNNPAILNTNRIFPWTGLRFPSVVPKQDEILVIDQRSSPESLLREQYSPTQKHIPASLNFASLSLIDQVREIPNLLAKVVHELKTVSKVILEILPFKTFDLGRHNANGPNHPINKKQNYFWYNNYLHGEVSKGIMGSLTIASLGMILVSAATQSAPIAFCAAGTYLAYEAVAAVAAYKRGMKVGTQEGLHAENGAAKI